MSRQLRAYVWLFALFGIAASVLLISIVGHFGPAQWLPHDLAWSLFWLLIAGLLFLVAIVMGWFAYRHSTPRQNFA
jgi:hypothetical protein